MCFTCRFGVAVLHANNECRSVTDDAMVVNSDVYNGVQSVLGMRSGISPETYLVTPPHDNAPRTSCSFVRA